MKDGESEEEELDNAENKKRCYVCREKGHEAADCLKDPNMRTTHNPQNEESRIMSYYRPKQTNIDADCVT